MPPAGGTPRGGRIEARRASPQEETCGTQTVETEWLFTAAALVLAGVALVLVALLGEAEFAPPRLFLVMRGESAHQRARLRRFCETLVGRTADYPGIVRVLSAQLALHGVAAELWPGPRTWEPVLVDAARALGVRRDELTDEERAAAASVGAAILAVLRTQVARMSVTDEHILNFSRATLAVRELLDDFDPERVSRLETELRDALGSAVSSETVFLLACDAQVPERGLARGLRLLADDYGIVAQERNGAIELYKELPAAAEYFLLLALGLADDGEAPVVTLGRTPTGAVGAVWQAPWFVVDHKGSRGHWGTSTVSATAYRRWESSPLRRR